MRPCVGRGDSRVGPDPNPRVSTTYRGKGGVRVTSRKTFVVAATLWLLAAGAAWGAGPVIGWGRGAPPPKITASAIAVPIETSGGCAIQASSGAVVCWGNDSTPPASVNGATGTASAISGGSCAIQAGSGAVVCWGFNGEGQATPPPSVNGTTGTATAIG